ncbi:MAG: hypothetical protein ABIQ70_03275, partial [Dokdonella sp.]
SKSTGSSRGLMSTTLYRAIADSLDRLAICEQDRGQFFYSLVRHLNMAIHKALLLLGLAICTDSAAYETEALISIRQDFSGLGAHTLELFLKKDGTVIEEQYNIYAHDISSMDIIKKVRKVPKQRIQQVVARAAALIAGLPEDVGQDLVVDPVTKKVKERIVVDPETKAIRIRFNGQKLFAGWSSYETTPPSKATEQFQHAWQSLQDLLRGPDA